MIFSPSSKFLDPEMNPVMEPSRFFLNLLITGTPLGGCFEAGGLLVEDILLSCFLTSFSSNFVGSLVPPKIDRRSKSVDKTLFPSKKYLDPDRVTTRELLRGSFVLRGDVVIDSPSLNEDD